MAPNQEKPHTTPYHSLIYLSTYDWVKAGPEKRQEDKMSLYPGRVLEHEGQPDEEEGGQGDVQLDYGHNGPEQ